MDGRLLSRYLYILSFSLAQTSISCPYYFTISSHQIPAPYQFPYCSLSTLSIAFIIVPDLGYTCELRELKVWSSDVCIELSLHSHYNKISSGDEKINQER